MSVRFDKSKNSWISDKEINGKRYYMSYSVNKYGKYAKFMAEYSYVNNIKLNNYFEEKDEYVVIYTYNKKDDKYLEILVDKDDFYSIVNQYYWGAYRDKQTYYAITFIGRHEKLRLHRLVTNAPEGLVPDHLNGNGLDNRKINLKIKTNQKNALNVQHATRNKVGCNGVHKCDNNYRAMWVDKDTGKHKTKKFSIKKYGEETAFKLACDYRKEMEKLNDYENNEN